MSTALATIDTASPEIIDRINSEHAACVGSFKQSLEHAINCGNLLREIRLRTAHGEWRTWIDEHFTASQRTADVYMQVANAHHQNPLLIEETEGCLQAAVSYIGRQAGGTQDLNLDEEEIVDAEIVTEPTYALTLAQLTSLACKRWHRPPGEKDVRAWLKDAGIA